MMEIGGYIELEHYALPMLHEDAIALNCGRNCLAYLIKARGITRIALPYFLCDSVINLCSFYNVEVRYYHINESLFPEDIMLEEGEWMYIVNYYGQLSIEQIKELQQKHVRVIVDNAQAYFDMPVKGVDSLYTCRKFFGVPDGAFLYTDAVLDEEFDQDESFERMTFLLGRYERTASEFYSEYVKNNIIFDNEPIKKMSKLTQNLLHSLEYNRIKKNRTDNYLYISEELGNLNLLTTKNIEGAFAYPLLLEDASSVRRKLIENKIYIPILWPNVFESMETQTIEYRMADKILPIPCDQRYGVKELEYVCALIKQLLKS